MRYDYGDDPSQFGELYLPAADGAVPVVVLVHGGFWQAGYGLDLMDDLAADVVARGWAAWNIEYRRVGQDGGGWPGTFKDVAAAVDHLTELSSGDASAGRDARGVAGRLDLERVAVVGHSAGGHLAVWSAGRVGLPAGAPGAGPRVVPKAVVSQAGVLDLVAAAEQGVGQTAVPDFMGAAPAAEPERYRLASPVAQVPIGVPVRCVHALQDDIVPIDQSKRYVQAATDAGDPAELASFVGDHFAVLIPAELNWTDAATWLATHLDR